MLHVPLARLTVAALVFHSLSAAAEPIAVDLRAAIDRAHRFAPGAVAARGHVAEAEAGVIGAEVTFTTNPEIEGGLGPRFVATRPLDAELRLEQNLEPWRRSPRRQLAHGEVGRAKAEAAVSLRELDREVSLAFYDAVFADRVVELARHGQDLARRAAEVATRRRQAGDLTDLDANLSRVAFARAKSAVWSATSERSLAIGRLAALIGAGPDDTVTVRGDLEPAAPDVAALRRELADRPDVRLFAAERDVAVAEHANAVASGRPAIGVWAAYQREDTDSIVLGGLRLTLPLWNRAQGEQAAARAKQHRASETHEATLRVAKRQLGDAVAAFTDANQAVETFEREAVPLLDDSDALLQHSVDAGQLAVSDYLIARQQLLDGRREHLDRLRARAGAAVGVWFAAGVTP